MSIKIKLVASPGELKDKVRQKLNELDKEFFVGSPLYPKDKNYWWFVYDGDKVVGFAGLTHYEANNSCFLARVAICKSHRGMGLQRKLIKVRERLAAKLGVERVITYTSCDNVVSSNNLIKCGYTLYIPKFFYGFRTSLYWVKRFD